MLIGTTTIYESMNRGDSLANLNVTGSATNALAYGSRLNGVNQPDVFYVGTDTNIWHRVTLGGPITSLSSYPGSSVRSLAMSPQNYRFLVVVDDQNRVWSSSDEGVTWSNLTDNLPSLSSDVRAVVVLVTNSNVTKTLVAGQNGVFNASGPVGARWVQLRPGLPHALFFDIYYNATNDVLAASALGRGAWTLTGFFNGPGAAAAVTSVQTTKAPLRLPRCRGNLPRLHHPRLYHLDTSSLRLRRRWLIYLVATVATSVALENFAEHFVSCESQNGDVLSGLSVPRVCAVVGR